MKIVQFYNVYVLIYIKTNYYARCQFWAVTDKRWSNVFQAAVQYRML